MARTVTGLLYMPALPPVQVTVEDTLKAFQALLGDCYVERIVLEWRSQDRGIALWCDEEGLLKDLPFNLWAGGPHYLGAPIHGPAFVCGLRRVYSPEPDEVSVDLSPSELVQWSALDRSPRRELVLKSGGVT